LIRFVDTASEWMLFKKRDHRNHAVTHDGNTRMHKQRKHKRVSAMCRCLLMAT
jgi:hypothetical protein